MAKIYIGDNSSKSHLIKNLYVGVNNQSKSVKAMYLGVNGKSKLIYKKGKPINSLSVGSTVKIKNTSGVYEDYRICYQGKPSSLYDDSCNGTWIQRTTTIGNMTWNNSKSDLNVPGDYSTSNLHKYLDSTYWATIDPSVQKSVKQVKIPYGKGERNSGYDTNVFSGTDGLLCHVFAPSARELGSSGGPKYEMPNEGSEISFLAPREHWWTRTPGHFYLEKPQFQYPLPICGVYRYGENNYNHQWYWGVDWTQFEYTNGAVPIMILNSTALVDDNGILL